jgi:hypothetical protein
MAIECASYVFQFSYDRKKKTGRQKEEIRRDRERNEDLDICKLDKGPIGTSFWIPKDGVSFCEAPFKSWEILRDGVSLPRRLQISKN